VKWYHFLPIGILIVGAIGLTIANAYNIMWLKTLIAIILAITGIVTYIIAIKNDWGVHNRDEET
jgi:NAD/NADP transhydrogenase beta subunit